MEAPAQNSFHCYRCGRKGVDSLLHRFFWGPNGFPLSLPPCFRYLPAMDNSGATAASDDAQPRLRMAGHTACELLRCILTKLEGFHKALPLPKCFIEGFRENNYGPVIDSAFIPIRQSTCLAISSACCSEWHALSTTHFTRWWRIPNNRPRPTGGTGVPSPKSFSTINSPDFVP